VRVGIYGGTFNPPHIGHEEAVKTAALQLGLDKLIIVPSGIPPHKPLPPGTACAKDRLLMAQNAFGGLANTEISDIEITSTSPSYTVDTVQIISQKYPNAELFLLCGTDMFLSLESWKGFNTLTKLVTAAVFARDENDRQSIAKFTAHLNDTYSKGCVIIDNEVVSISSSKLREMLPKREGFGYIKDTNYTYIIDSRLYSAKPDWGWLREKAYSMLEKKRIPHVAACEDAAVSLAERWGVDVDEAREAAILHDITKRLDTKGHLSVLRESGVTVGEVKPAEDKLLHAKSGAALAYARFGVSEEVRDAIRWHTTGKAGMSNLAKVLYLADYIEATRSFAGVEKLRELAYEDIDKAMVMGLEMTLKDVVKRGITPANSTLDAIEDLKK